MVIDKGESICEKCNQKFAWLFADTSFQSKNIMGVCNNGTKYIASIRCPFCKFVQQNSLIYDVDNVKVK